MSEHPAATVVVDLPANRAAHAQRFGVPETDIRRARITLADQQPQTRLISLHTSLRMAVVHAAVDHQATCPLWPQQPARWCPTCYALRHALAHLVAADRLSADSLAAAEDELAAAAGKDGTDV